MAPKAHVAEYKKKIVKDIADLIMKYPIIGAINVENIPAPQMSIMRAKLRGRAELRMTKRRLIKLAIAQVKDKKKGIGDIEKHLLGLPALLFSNENPFKLFALLKKNQSPAPAKPGQTAPFDIIIPAGPTPFAPGPIISEFGAVGIKTGVEGGKVSVKSDSIVAKQGDKIKPKVAELLARLDVKPMKIGLDLVAVYENGIIYGKDVLNIDEEEFAAKLGNCRRWAFNLAIFTAYPTKDTTKHLIGKAFRDARAICVSQGIVADKIIGDLLAKAEMQASGLKQTANI